MAVTGPLYFTVTLPLPLRFTVHGAPRTKKNHGRLVRPGRGRRTVLLPSKPWETWAKTARLEGLRGPLPRLAVPLNCRALFYRDAARGDAVGFMQGLADLLQKRGVVADDKWLVAWDGSRLLLDRQHPRVEVELASAESVPS